MVLQLPALHAPHPDTVVPVSRAPGAIARSSHIHGRTFYYTTSCSHHLQGVRVLHSDKDRVAYEMIVQPQVPCLIWKSLYL